MNKFHKRLTFLILFVAGISAAVIYFTVDVETLRSMNTFNAWTIPAILALMGVGMYFDGTRLLHLVHIAGKRITLIQAVQVIFSNYFLALLTPGAAGGAVAQVMFLRRAGVPTGIATVVVLIRTLMSILVLFALLPFVFLNDPDLFPWIPTRVLISVSLALVGLAAGGIWFLRSDLSVRLLKWMARKLNAERRRTLFGLYRDTRGAVFMMLSAPKSMLRVFLESGASLLSLYCMVPALFLGLGIHFDWLVVLGRMVFLNILLYFAPTPGGSGIAEGGFVVLFSTLVPFGTVGILAVAWRIVAEYLPFAIGLYFTIRVFGRDFLYKQVK